MVAIILVNYNGAEDTIDCIESLSKIQDIDCEVIVVDNHSTNDSIVKLQEAKKEYAFQLIEAKENAGFSAGNNIGLRYARQKNAAYYLLLNNDTIVEPDFLSNLLTGFNENSECGLTTGKILYYSNPNVIWYAGGAINMQTARTEHYLFGKIDKGDDNTLQKVTFASGCCMCLSRDLLDKVGYLNEDYFLYEEDAEYCCRIMQAGFSIIYVPKAVIYHKVSASTGAGSVFSQYYTIRNKYNLIRSSYGKNRIYAYAYNTFQMLYRCIKHELNFKCYMAAVKAFLRKEKGKVEVRIR